MVEEFLGENVYMKKPKVIKIEWGNVQHVFIDKPTGHVLQKSFDRWYRVEPITDKVLIQHLEKEYEKRLEEEEIIKNQCWGCKNHVFEKAWGYDSWDEWICKHGLSDPSKKVRCVKRNIS